MTVGGEVGCWDSCVSFPQPLAAVLARYIMSQSQLCGVERALDREKIIMPNNNNNDRHQHHHR